MKELEKARIIRVDRSRYKVQTEAGQLTVSLSGKLQHLNAVPVIGDYVKIERISQTEGVIQEISERTSYLSRPDGKGHADGYVKTYLEQAMAANLDYLFIITSMNDDFSVNRIARFITTSLKGGCKPVIILTKSDLCRDKEAFVQKASEICPTVDVLCVSSYTGEGLDEIKKYMLPGVTIGLMGSSGVGKSTLINKLAGRTVMKVNEIRDKDSKGKHTTTHRELLDINGTCFIDTPGMREFGICEADEGIEETFEDIAELISCCKFSDCSHSSEPSCAIKAALEDGTLSQKRWELYKSLTAESNRSAEISFKKRVAIQKKKLSKQH